MDKVSNEQLVKVLSEVGPALRKLAADRDNYRAQLQTYERKAAVEKVASAMIQKGLSNEPFERVMEQLTKAAEQGKLPEISRAVDLTGPDMGQKVARMIDANESGDASSLEDEHPFVQFLMGGIR